MMGWCWHKWNVVEKVEHQSPFEMTSNEGLYLERARGIDVFRKPVIVTYRCEKCGSEKVERV